MKMILVIWLILIPAVVLAAADAAPVMQETDPLTYKEAILARTGEEGQMVAAPDGAFRRGEAVNLVLRQVGKFEKGTDGKHQFDIDLLVIGPDGSITLDETNLLGDNGHVLLENDTASSPYGIFETHVRLLPGKYQMTVTIRDKISGDQVSATKSLTLSEGLSHQKTIFARTGENGKLQPIREPVFSRGETVNMVFLNVGLFEKDADGKNAFDIDMLVKDDAGKVIFQQEKMLGENGHIVLENNVAKSPYGMFYSSIEMEAGVYRMTLSIYDTLNGEKITVTKPFTLK